MLAGRIMRLTAAVRKQLTPDVLSAFVASSLAAEAPLKAQLASVLEQVRSRVCGVRAGAAGHRGRAANGLLLVIRRVDQVPKGAMDTDAAAPAAAPTTTPPPAPSSTPEVELFAALLVLMYLVDHKLYPQVCVRPRVRGAPWPLAGHSGRGTTRDAGGHLLLCRPRRSPWRAWSACKASTGAPWTWWRRASTATSPWRTSDWGSSRTSAGVPGPLLYCLPASHAAGRRGGRQGARAAQCQRGLRGLCATRVGRQGHACRVHSLTCRRSRSRALSPALTCARSTLLALHRTSHLRHDVVGQETLLNLLLRNYLHHAEYDQADKFRSKAQRTEVVRSHHQYCRRVVVLGAASLHRRVASLRSGQRGGRRHARSAGRPPGMAVWDVHAGRMECLSPAPPGLASPLCAGTCTTWAASGRCSSSTQRRATACSR